MLRSALDYQRDDFGSDHQYVPFTIRAPALTSIVPNGGVQGQTAGVTLTGTDFATGATVNVGGALITVTNTTVVSSTQIAATFAIAANAALALRISA